MAEVSGAILVLAMASFAHVGSAHRSKAGIVQTASHRLPVHGNFNTIHSIGLAVLSFGYGILNHFLRRENAEVNLANWTERCNGSIQGWHGNSFVSTHMC